MAAAVQRAKATLEMDLEGPAPAGAVTSAEGVRLTFAGWTELAPAIEKWRAGARASHAVGATGARQALDDWLDAG